MVYELEVWLLNFCIVLQALEILEEEQKTPWKEWEAFQVMLKLGASCESTYDS